MGKVKKIYYLGNRLTKSFLKEVRDFFVFILWISGTPLSTKVFMFCWEEIVSPSTVKENLNRFYKKKDLSPR
jgi:hypothetical protein